MSKPKFKVGDMVIGNDEANMYNVTRKGWVGQITLINEDGSVIWVTGVDIINCPVRAFCFDLYKPASNNKIVVTTDGKVTTATLYNGREKVKTAKSSCRPEDTFDFKTGAKIAFNNLIKEESKVKPIELLKNGMFVMSQDNDWYVKVDGVFVGENGEFKAIDLYDNNLCFFGDSHYCINAIVDAMCFTDAKIKYKKGNIVWKRTK